MRDSNGKTIILTSRQQAMLGVANAAILGYIIGIILLFAISAYINHLPA